MRIDGSRVEGRAGRSAALALLGCFASCGSDAVHGAELSRVATREVPRGADGRQQVRAAIADELYDPLDALEPDLERLPRCSPEPGTSAAHWSQLSEAAQRLVLPGTEATWAEASATLRGAGRAAFPAVVNALLELDYRGPLSHDAGLRCDQVLASISAGRSLGWRRGWTSEPNKASLIARRTVALYAESWRRILDEPGYWERYSGLRPDADSAR